MCGAYHPCWSNMKILSKFFNHNLLLQISVFYFIQKMSWHQFYLKLQPLKSSESQRLLIPNATRVFTSNFSVFRIGGQRCRIETTESVG